MYKPIVKLAVNGVETELYTIGYTAKLLKRSVETVRAWERQKVIPRSMYRFGNNVRLYHPKEVEVMKKILRRHGKYAHQDDLRRAMWEELAIVRKEILNVEVPDKVQTNM